MKTSAILLLPFLLLSILTGCANIKSQNRLDLLETQLSQHRKAIRWGELKLAATDRRPRDDSELAPLGKKLEGLRVVSYEPGPPSVDESGAEARLSAEISYYFDLEGQVKQISYPQVWYFDEDSGRWWLDGDLPPF